MTNVVYIHTHDSGRFFSPYGYEVPTPNLEQFAADACVFTNAYCTSPTCSPSRSALLSGRYPHNNGMMGLGNRGFKMNDYNEHLVHLFNQNGYQTLLCGVQHEAGRYVEHEHGASIIGYQKDISADNQGMSEKELIKWDQANVERCVQWLKSDEANKPFFLSMGFFATHREYPDVKEAIKVKTPEYLMDCEAVQEDLQGHVESLKHFDTCFGKLIQALKESNRYEDTILMFTTDHGIPYPMAKCTLYDAGIGVALIMRVPGKKQGIRCDELVSQVDVYPTLCSLLGLKPEHEIDGVSFADLLDDPCSSIRNAIYAEVNFHTSYEPIRCIRTKDLKLIRYYDDQWPKLNLSNIDNSISKEAYIRQIQKNQKDMVQLYDLKLDPYEKHNLADDQNYAVQLKMMDDLLVQWQKTFKDPLLSGNIEIRDSWVVNKSSCIDPKSKNSCDFIKK